jgi:multicomponent Na+:H+ antiporter subunit F
MNIVLIVVFSALLASIALSFVRVVRGPTLPDRVAALELLNVLTVAFVAVYTVWSGVTAFIDAAVALALIAFLGTIAFARYVERGSRQ